MDEEKVDVLCNHCGQAFSTFLHQMEEHNAKVVCPACGKKHDQMGTSKMAQAPPKKH